LKGERRRKKNKSRMEFNPTEERRHAAAITKKKGLLYHRERAMRFVPLARPRKEKLQQNGDMQEGKKKVWTYQAVPSRLLLKNDRRSKLGGEEEGERIPSVGPNIGGGGRERGTALRFRKRGRVKRRGIGEGKRGGLAPTEQEKKANVNEALGRAACRRFAEKEKQWPIGSR